MLWLQAGICFIAWIVFGVWLRSRAESIRDRIGGTSRTQRVLLGSAGLIMGLVGLLTGLWLIAGNGGIQAGSLTGWAWLACLGLGLGFVYLQVLGATAMITLVIDEETDRRRRASIPEEPSNP